jgi:hypothetical protein
MSSSDSLWAKRKLKESPEARERRLARCRAYSKAHREEFKVYQQEYLARKEREDPSFRTKRLARSRKNTRARIYRIRYGISVADFDAMFARQRGRCAVCKRKQEDTKTPKRRLCVDHSHTTRRLRELLCGSCNSMLGFAGDDANTLVKGAIYLVKHGGKRPLRKLVNALNRLVSGVRSSRSARSKSRSKSRGGVNSRRRRKSSHGRG